MICKKCGNNIPDNVLFCSKCGTPVKQENETAKTVKKKNGSKKGLLIAIISVTVVLAVILVVVFVSQRNTTNDDSYNEVNDNYNEIDDSYNDDSGNEQNYEEPFDENQIENNILNEDSNNIGENDYNEDVEKNNTDDEVIELKKSDAYFINGVCNEYGQKDSEDFFGLAFMNENDIIQILDRSKTISIYTAYDSVRFVPVISEAKYTVGYDFEDGIDYGTGHVKVSDFPSIITGGISGIQGQLSPYSSYGFSKLTSPGHPIQECNGILLEDFMAENSKEYFSSAYSYYPHLYIEAEPNETFTFGGYIGTEWVEEELKADVEFYEIDGAIIIVPEKTKNGYFTIDCSELASGLYYVIEFNTFVQLV